MSVIGVPVKVLHEAEGHIVTVETTTGEVSWGKVPSYRVSHDTGHPEIWLSPRPFLKSGT